ncbi:UNVERIFIED_CONTAM: hypothetical protein GTU68_043067 [Idotea baltica]|nr:hypothetical protein [Idotea baltica]
MGCPSATNRQASSMPISRSPRMTRSSTRSTNAPGICELTARKAVRHSPRRCMASFPAPTAITGTLSTFV